MKKLISILTVFAMVLAFAAIPAMAADVTVDFTSEDNIAYGMSMNAIQGKHFYAKNSTAPVAGKQYGTDGDITTYHHAATRTNISWGTRVGSEVNLDLGDAKTVTKVTLYAQPTMNDGSNDRSNTSLTIYVYGGADTTTGTQIGAMTNEGAKIVSDGTNEMEMYVYTIEFPANSIYQYITFDCNSAYFWGWNEIYVEGATASVTDADKVAADKEALDLGDTTAVTANLTLPTTGSAFGSTITWATTDASVITDAGVITRVGENKTATLTATITSGTATDTKEFTVTVPGYEVYNLDLSAENNILLGKTITPIAGRYYSSSTPSAEKQLATDGNLTTLHSGNGKVSGVVTGLVFSVDLEEEYLVDNVTLLIDPSQVGREIKIYNGNAVDQTKLLGSYAAASTPNYVVAGEQEKALAVVSCDLPDYTRASQLTIAYEQGYDFTYYEIAATGSLPEEGVIYRDFKSSDNLAYGKNNERVIGHFYDGWTPASDDLATDGDITTTKRCAGRYSGDDSGNGYYGSAFRIDLGAYYDLTELTLYTSTTTSSISFRSEDAFTVTGSGQSSSYGGYILNSLGGQLHTNGFATVKGSEAVQVNVNGTDVYAYSADLSANAQPVRYIIVHLNGGTWTYNELYVAGTPFTGKVAFAEGDFIYEVDEETSAKTVTAQVSLMNKTDAAASGDIYFAAFNEAGEVVGVTKVADVTVDAGATYSAPTTFSVSAPAGYVKAFYWADGTFVPVIADIICD